LREIIVHLSPRGFGNAKSTQSVLSRLDYYMEMYKTNFSEIARMTVLLNSHGLELKSSKVDEFANIEVKFLDSKSLNRLVYLVKSTRYIQRNKKNINLIVAGDPWVAPILGLVYSRLYRIPLQIQFHGEFTNYVNSLKISERIKYEVIKLITKRAHSIRLVSSFQKSLFEESFPHSIEKTFIAPIPTMIRSTPSDLPRAGTVGFLGRMHKERGVELWAQVAVVIASKLPESDFLLIGDGSEKQFLKSALTSITPGRVNFTGWLETAQVTESIRQMRVLLVTAENETFGVSMREALLSGVYVVALENSATSALAQMFPDQVFLGKNKSDLVNLVQNTLKRDFPQAAVEEIKRVITAENSISMKNLGSSWKYI
jgi:glycosyltransferase involved in cell wall biosynthesis